MSQKHYKFVTLLETMERSCSEKVRKHIENHDAGSLFFVEDFLQYGTPDNIRQALTRMHSRGIIRRAASGIYFVPKLDKWDGAHLYPSPNDIAKAVAMRSGTRVVPNGQNALNILGLTTQVPASICYMTDGANRRIETSSGQILEFRHTSDMKWFGYKSEIMLLIVIAMREIGEKNLNAEDMYKIKRHLQNVNREDFDHDVKLAPQWVIKQLIKL